MVHRSLDGWGTWLKIGALLLTWAVPLPGAGGANILVVPVDGSHWINMKVLIVELTARGHDITVLRSSSSWYITEQPGLYRTLTVRVDGKLGILEDHEMMANFVVRSLEIFRGGKTLMAFVHNTQAIRHMLRETHRHMRSFISLLFEDRALMGRLEGAGFELVLTDPFYPTGVMLARHLKLPLVYNTRWLSTGDCHTFIAPSPTSYVPIVGSRYTETMSFFQRISNAVQYFIMVTLSEAMIHPGYDELCRRYISPDASLVGLTQMADLWLMRVDFVLDFPRPTMPNIVYIGGFQCKPAQPLSPDLEEFMQSSGEHGVVYMSLGSTVTSLPAYLTANIAEAFAQLPQKVIWRHMGEAPPNLGKNTLLTKWIPQNDILGHPKTVAFVSHGGTNGLYEAIYHGVPVVGLPLVFDQFDNLVRLEARGAATLLDATTLESGQLLDALGEVLTQPAYRRNMQRLSALHRDQPERPMDRAVFWIEFVVRHKGAAHLRPASFALSWYAYYGLDIVAFLVLAWFVLTALALLGLRKLCGGRPSCV